MESHLFASVELSQLAGQITTAVLAGERAAKTAASDFRAAGEMLLRAKDKLPHGEFQAWVEPNIKRSYRQAARWMRLAKSDAMSLLEDQWAIICGHGDEASDGNDGMSMSGESSHSSPARPTPNRSVTSSPAATPILCMGCQKRGAVKNCPRCLALRTNDDAEPATSQSAGPGSAGGDPPVAAPAPVVSLATRTATAYERLDSLFQAAFKTRELPRTLADQTHGAMREVHAAVEAIAGAQVRKPSPSRCRQCGATVLWVVTENDKLILLEHGKGSFEVIDGLAVVVEKFAGEYRNHFLHCTKGQSEDF